MDPELEQAARARIGTTIRDKYRIDALLGVGGMAVVYRATHRNQAEFAIKMLHAELSMRESLRQRFLREGYAANSVKHPGVVAVVDDDIAEDGAAFLVMELLVGTAVDALAKANGKRLPVPTVCAILDQLLEVLGAAHAKGIVHRDIKPANLFITTEGTLKVLDFGIARVRDAMSKDKTMTGSGVLLGTPGFMSPEQALGQHDGVDARTNIWGAAATFFKLVSGKLVHSGENSTQLMLAAATKMPRSIATVADVPSPIARVIDRALDFDIGSRWSSAEEMRRALYAATSESFGAAPSRATLAAGKLPTGGANPTEMSRPSLPTPNITEPPVSTMTPYFEPTYAPPPKPRSLLVPIISVAAIFGLVCFVGIRVLDRAATSSPSEPSAVPMAIAPASTTPPVQTTATPTAEPTAATDDSTARRSSGKKPTGAAAASSTAIRARPVAAPLTNCDPPYYFNANNDKVFKKECL